jgi:hypothetical protein
MTGASKRIGGSGDPFSYPTVFLICLTDDQNPDLSYIPPQELNPCITLYEVFDAGYGGTISAPLFPCLD